MSRYEQPDYAVVQRGDDFEIRRYDPYLVAETEIRAGFGESGSIAFRRLAGYIFGRNRESVKMNMTVPVTHEPIDDGRHLYRFVMERRYSEDTLPAPVDEGIAIVRIPGGLYAAARYRGNRDERRFRREERRLLAALERAGIRAAGRPVKAVYDGPFVPPPLRRNEVLIPVSLDPTQSETPAGG